MTTNNAINTPIITLGGTFTMIGAFTFAGTITANTAVTFPTSGTLLSTANYPAAGAASGAIIISNGTNFISSTSLWPNTVGTALHLLISDGTSNVYSTPAYPNASVTTGKVIISDGTNYIASTSIFPNTVGSAGTIIRSDGTVNAYTTATYPNSVTINRLLWVSASNVISDLATANSSVLVTDSGGVPSLSSTLPAFTTSSITFNPTTGGIVGTTTNDNTAAGKVGEYISASVLTASAVSLVSGTPKTITSISLTAGDWDVTGTVVSKPAGTTTTSFFSMGISQTTNAFETLGAENNFMQAVGIGAGAFLAGNNGRMRISLSGTTTVYLVASVGFAISTMAAYGFIGARRVR